MWPPCYVARKDSAPSAEDGVAQYFLGACWFASENFPTYVSGIVNLSEAVVKEKSDILETLTIAGLDKQLSRQPTYNGRR
jgi:hypothetical protein